MIMKKIYIKPLMKDHKLQHTNGLLVVASLLDDGDGKVYDEIVDACFFFLAWVFVGEVDELAVHNGLDFDGFCVLGDSSFSEA